MKNRTFLGIKLICYCIIFVMLGIFAMRFMSNTTPMKIVSTVSSKQYELTGNAEYMEIDKLQVDITSYGIEVEQHAGSSVLVEYYGVDPDRLVVTAKDGTLLIKQDAHTKLFDWQSGKVLIKVPTQKMTEMILETVSGSVTANIVADYVEASSVSGSIRIDGEGSKLVASSISGSIRNMGDFETVEAHATSGSIRTATSRRTTELNLQSVSGSIRIALADNLGYAMNYSSVSGSVKDEYHGMQYKGTGVCSYGDQQVSIHAGTTSGSIKLTEWE